jgi:hypothetical protein
VAVVAEMAEKWGILLSLKLQNNQKEIFLDFLN